MKLFDSALLKLTAAYLAIIMVISISFSVVLYRVASEEISRGLPAGVTQFLDRDGVVRFLDQRAVEANGRLLNNLVFVNIVTLVLSGGLSYFLARRTLQPIQDAMEAQSRFTSDASHELRTPLASMQSEIEVALRNDKLSKTDMRQLLQSNLEEVHALRGLSDRLLQLSNGKDMQLEPISLEDVAIDAVTRVVAVAQAKNIRVENNVGTLRVIGNKESLADILCILLDNAIKYSPPKTVVTLSTEVQGRQAVVKVVDQGHGIKASDLPHIFDRFYRADTSRNKQQVQGYGLGLAIAKKLVDVHGGTIAVQSAPDEGTTFTIKLPLA